MTLYDNTYDMLKVLSQTKKDLFKITLMKSLNNSS